MDFDDNSYTDIKKKAKLTRGLEIIPASFSIKQYTPLPKSQGMFGTCAAWASAYCGRTMVEAIKNNWTDKKTITANAYSPAFLFRMIRPEDSVCVGGSYISQAFELMKEKGLLTYNDLSLSCTPAISAAQLATAEKGKVKDYMRLFDIGSAENIKIQSVKKSISEKKPVVFGMVCPPSFMWAKGVWNATEQPDKSFGGHAMCVVGYDDTKEALVLKSNALSENVILIIFYAGHGIAEKDKFGDVDGYWIPSSAKKGLNASYISSDDINKALKRSNSKHILVIADACFSGAFTRELSADASVGIQKQFSVPSRKIMASGNLEPVPDNSKFVYYLKKNLKENKLFTVGTEVLIPQKVMLCYQSGGPGGTRSSVLAEFVPVLATNTEIRQQIQLITGFSGAIDKKKLNNEIMAHLFDNYGKIGAEELAALME